MLPVDDHGKDKKEEEGADLSVTFVLVFLLIASITLVLLYLFYKVRTHYRSLYSSYLLIVLGILLTCSTSHPPSPLLAHL